jgi:hypothetical protein
MKIKLQLKRTPDSAPEYYYTNLFVVTEWERLERRNIQQLSANPLYSDYACWMHTILKIKGEQVGDRPKPYGRGTYRRQLAEVLVAVGWWPSDIAFDSRDLATVIKVLNEANKKRR